MSPGNTAAFLPLTDGTFAGSSVGDDWAQAVLISSNASAAALVAVAAARLSRQFNLLDVIRCNTGVGDLEKVADAACSSIEECLRLLQAAMDRLNAATGAQGRAV